MARFETDFRLRQQGAATSMFSVLRARSAQNGKQKIGKYHGS
jgi:hypothetical protein